MGHFYDPVSDSILKGMKGDVSYMGKRFNRVKIYKAPCLYKDIEINMKITEALSDIEPVAVDKNDAIRIRELGIYTYEDFIRFFTTAIYSGIEQLRLVIAEDKTQTTFNKETMFYSIIALMKACNVNVIDRNILLMEILNNRRRNKIEMLLFYINNGKRWIETGHFTKEVYDHMLRQTMIIMMNDISKYFGLNLIYQERNY